MFPELKLILVINNLISKTFKERVCTSLPKRYQVFCFFEYKYVDRTYKEEAHDIITVHRKKTIKTFFGKSKEIEFTDTYKFYRTTKKSTTEAHTLAQKLYTQLNELMGDRWYCITKEQYNLIKETYPEILI